MYKPSVKISFEYIWEYYQNKIYSSGNLFFPKIDLNIKNYEDYCNILINL